MKQWQFLTLLAILANMKVRAVETHVTLSETSLGQYMVGYGMALAVFAGIALISWTVTRGE